MIFITAAAAVFAVLFIQYRFYKKHCFDHVVYSAAFSSDEVYAGDDIYLYEEISNTGRIPLPYIKIDSELPDGLFFTLIEEEREGAGEGAGEKKKPAPRGFRRSAGAASAGGESGRGRHPQRQIRQSGEVGFHTPPPLEDKAPLAHNLPQTRRIPDERSRRHRDRPARIQY